MLTIRLTRKGKKNQPFFRVVVIDSRRSSKGGRAVEDLGYVDPIAKRKAINVERAKHWVSVGAQPSATVHNLLVTEKVIKDKKVPLTNVTKRHKEAQAKVAAEKAAAEAAAKAAAEAPKEEPKAEEKPAEPSASAEGSSETTKAE